MTKNQLVYEALAQMLSELSFDKYAMEDPKVFLDKLIEYLYTKAYGDEDE